MPRWPWRRKNGVRRGRVSGSCITLPRGPAARVSHFCCPRSRQGRTIDSVCDLYAFYAVQHPHTHREPRGGRWARRRPQGLSFPARHAPDPLPNLFASLTHRRRPKSKEVLWKDDQHFRFPLCLRPALIKALFKRALVCT